MATCRKWMALPMGLTALALDWLLWRQMGGGSWAYPVGAIAMTLLIANQAGARQRGGGKRNLLIVAAPFLLLLLLVPPARQPDHPGHSITAVAAKGRLFTPSALPHARVLATPDLASFSDDWCT